MFGTVAAGAAYGACLRGIGRVNIYNTNTRNLCLVRDEILELAERPAVQAGTHFTSLLDVPADVRQILHCDRGKTVLHRFGDNGLADFVVDVPDVPRLSAGGLCQELSGALGAVALKALQSARNLSRSQRS